MALVRLQDVDWTLTDKRQDIRGRELRDAVGRPLGTIDHMIVDTEQERVVSVRLEDATEYPADDLQIMEDAVYYIPPDGPAGPAATTAVPPDMAADPVAPPPVDPAPATVTGFAAEDVAAEDPAVASPAVTVPLGDAAIPAPPEGALAEPMPAPAAEPQAPGAYLDADFRSHFDAEYAGGRLSYGALQFAYRFGFDAARTPPLADRSLPGVEESLRRVFYARFNYPASDELVWAVAGDAVRHGFHLGKR